MNLDRQTDHGLLKEPGEKMIEPEILLRCKPDYGSSSTERGANRRGPFSRVVTN